MSANEYEYQCTEHIVHLNRIFELEKKASSSLLIPDMDAKMLSTGLKNILHLETGELTRCYYLAEKVKKLPKKEVLDLLLGIFKFQQDRLYKDAKTADDIYEPCDLDYNLELLVQESKDSDYIDFGLNDYAKVSKKEFWSDDFGSQDARLKTLKSIIVNTVEFWEKRGISVDRIKFTSMISFATDLNKLSDYSLFVGISRVYDNVWSVQENPNPLTKDTYEVIYAIVAPENKNERTLEYLRKNLVEQIDEGFFKGYDEGDRKLFYDEKYNLTEYAENLVETLLNTPSNQKLKEKYISDAQLYAWDKERIKGNLSK